MLLCVIAPEIPVTLSMVEWLAARGNCKRFSEFSKHDNVQWTKAHCFFANSGGFVLHFPESYDTLDMNPESQMQLDLDGNKSTVSDQNSVASTSRRVCAELKAFESRVKICESRYGSSGWNILKSNRDIIIKAITQQVNNNTSLKETFDSSLVNLQGNYWIMNTNQLFYCREIGLVGMLPDIPEDTIGQMGQSDTFVKLIAAAQVFWMLFQVIIRASRSLHISQLEISTVAFAICTILAYGSWLDKPQNPVLTVPLHCQRMPTSAESIGFAGLTAHKRHLLRVSSLEATPKEGINRLWGTANSFVDFWSLGAIGAVVFGSIHFLAWNSSFPTLIEKYMWRVACIMLVVIPLSGTSFSLFLTSEGFPPHVIDVLVTVFVILYTIARLFVWVEIVRSLRHLEPEVFKTTWASILIMRNYFPKTKMV